MKGCSRYVLFKNKFSGHIWENLTERVLFLLVECINKLEDFDTVIKSCHYCIRGFYGFKNDLIFIKDVLWETAAVTAKVAFEEARCVTENIKNG